MFCSVLFGSFLRKAFSLCTRQFQENLRRFFNYDEPCTVYVL